MEVQGAGEKRMEGLFEGGLSRGGPLTESGRLGYCVYTMSFLGALKAFSTAPFLMGKRIGTWIFRVSLFMRIVHFQKGLIKECLRSQI